MSVNKKTHLRVEAELRPEISRALKAARAALGLSQSELAAVLGSSQGAITRWERKLNTPPVSAVTLLAQMVPEEQKEFWISAGAMIDTRVVENPTFRQVPVLRNAAAAGTPRAVMEAEIEFLLPIPPQMLPRGGKIFGVWVLGDSMSPILETGYLALIDVVQKKLAHYVGKMVVARNADGVTIKWLRKQSEDMYLLVPQNTSQRHPIQVIQPGGDWSIVGEVVKWIGEPPTPKRKG